MSKLDELICEFCSNGVETVKIKNAFQRLKGTPITAARMKEINNPEGEIKVFAGGKTVITAKEKDIPNANIIRVPAVLVQSRGVIDVIYYDKPFTFKNEMWAYTTSDSTTVKYLFYVLKNNVQRFRDAASGMGSLPQISLPVTEEFEIPLPPIEVQREIVRILDNFTNLTAELTAELTARKIQYSFYRSRLLTFDANVEWKTVDEIAEVTDYVANGSFAALKENVNYKHTPDYAILVRTTDLVNGFDEENLVYIDKHAYNYLSKSKLYGGEIIINNIGAGVGTTFLCPCLDTYMSLAPNSIMVKTNNNKFYYYWLNSKEGQNAIRKIVSQGSLPKFNKTGFRSIRLPVPPLDVQNRIVNVLDNFEKICSDLNIGLPAEIEARQKQYEYYRDKLLTFAENGNTILSRAEQSRAEQSRAEQSRALIKLLQYVFGYAMLPLSEIANVFRGEYITKKNEKAGNIPVILGGQEPAYYIDRANHIGEIVAVARSGASAGFVSYWDEPIFITDGFGYEVKKEVAIPKYLYYALKNKETELNGMKRGAGVPHVSGERLGEINLPVPPIEEQKRVVSTLDRFDAICNDLTSGLPAEIEARQKQYEYYRDKLLTFKERG